MENCLREITNYLWAQSWQIAILTVIIAAVSLLLNNKSAHIRYLLWLILLAKCFVPPLLTVPLAVLPQEQFARPIMETVANNIPMVFVETTETLAHEPVTLPVVELETTIFDKFAAVTMSQGLGALWILGVVVFVLTAGMKAIRLNHWLKHARKPLAINLQKGIKDLFAELGEEKFPKVWLVDGIGQPFVWGLLRGSIYLPTDFAEIEAKEHRRGILSHELSHVIRFDAAVNLLQIIAQAVFWFHPLIWWANKKIRGEREKCCDEMAIAGLGTKARDFSTAIVNILTAEHNSTLPVPSLAVAGPVKNIEDRIKTIMNPNKKFYKRPTVLAAITILLLAIITVPTTLALISKPAEKTTAQGFVENDSMRVYQVSRKVSDFPEVEDFSTPESAYATIMRDYLATGASDAEWSKISTWKSKDTKRKTVLPEVAQDYLNARIVEVRIFKERSARVIAEMKENGVTGYDQRTLFFHKGRWLNSGQDGLAPTLEAARDTFARKCARLNKIDSERLGEPVAERWNRPPVSDPEAYLKPYIDFLKKEGREPHAFMMKAFKKHQLVVMGEIHRRPQYWAFNTELIRDPSFAKTVGTIYMELPSNHQNNIDNFLTQNTCEKEIVIRMLRDFFELGWPCKPTLDFFVAVWQENQKLPTDKKLRIRLVDMQRPWEKIQERKDWQQYAVDRDLFMAQNILKDRQSYKDKRNGFFIVGMAHAMEGLYFADQKTPRKSAGWHLKQALGEQLFTVFQHAPVETNKGRVSGRLALGLIDTAFAQLSDRPVAFMLQKGPFGKLPFDGMPDFNVYGSFRDGYDACLYLIPLEDEIHSPLIDGFYSDDFMPEIDRRYRLMFGKTLFSDIDMPTPERVIKRQAYCGQLRKWARILGPENAWHYGDDWKTKTQKEHLANVQREELTTELDKIVQGIKQIDPVTYTWRTWEEKFGFNYQAASGYDAMYTWWCKVIKKHPFESVKYGDLDRNSQGLPKIRVTTTLQGGITLSKEFVFRYIPQGDKWQARVGLDFHLDPKWKDFPKNRKISLP
jgi:beta-lactamase regulating signal transducer with metallopeptidase domain